MPKISSSSTSQALPKYQQVFAELRREIVSGKYQSGQKLPSEADLVKRFGASRITVGRAVRDLHQEGLVDRRAGSGTYVRRATPSAANTATALTFGLLIPDLGRTEIFEPICQGMADSPLAAEHALLWPNVKTGSRQEQMAQLCQQFIARQISGVFFAPFESPGPDDRVNHQIIAALEKARIPVVFLDRDFLPYPHRSNHDLVGIDNRRTGYLATEHLIHLGSRRIVFLNHPRTAATLEERIAGYREALIMHGLPVLPDFIQRLPAEEDDTIRRIMETLQPDAIVCASDRTAGRLMHGLIALGIQVPRQVRIVGIDDIGYASLLPVPLTTMRQPCHEIGLAAMSTMLERIYHPTQAIRDVLLQCKLITRASCGAGPAAA